MSMDALADDAVLADRPVRSVDVARVLLRKHGAIVALVVVVLGWFWTFLRLGMLRHNRYWTFGFDLGLYNQAAWLIAHFKDPFVTLRGLDAWGHHGNFIFLLFAPFYWLGAGITFLLVAQLLSQCAGAVGVYLLSRDLLDGPRWIGVLLAGVFLMHPSMQFLAWEYFHPETFAIGPIVLAYWAIRTERMKTFWLMAVLALACKEDVALVFFMLGLLLAFRRKVRLGAMVSGVAVWWYLAVTKVLIPWRNPVGPFYENHFFAAYGGSMGEVAKTVLRHPSRLWRDLTDSGRVEFYSRVWAPVAFLPFLAPEVLAVALPMLLVIVMAGVVWVQDYRYHYVAIPLAITFIALVEAVRRLRTPRRRALAIAVVCLTTVITTQAWGAGPYSRNWNKGYWPHSRSESLHDIWFGTLDPEQNWPKAESKRRAVALVPDDASVSAAYNVNPHLSSRTHVYEWPNPWFGRNWGICEVDNLHDPKDVQWIIVDRAYLEGNTMELGLLDRLLRSEFAVRLDENGVVAAERVQAPATPRSPAPTSCR